MAGQEEKGYVAPPSIGHELGVMFGFIGLMIVMMAAYGIAWNMGNKKSTQKEIERRQALTDRGFGGEKMPARDSSGEHGQNGY